MSLRSHNIGMMMEEGWIVRRMGGGGGGRRGERNDVDGMLGRKRDNRLTWGG